MAETKTQAQVKAVETLQDIMVYDEAHYFGAVNAPAYSLGGVINSLTESSNPTESEKQYIHQKSKISKVTGYNNEFPLNMDMVKGDKVFDDFYQIWYKREVGNKALRDHIIVNLWEPVEMKENTFKARKITQTVMITDANGNPGEQKVMEGSLKGGDFVYGEFNVSTNTFEETGK